MVFHWGPSDSKSRQYSGRPQQYYSLDGLHLSTDFQLIIINIIIIIIIIILLLESFSHHC